MCGITHVGAGVFLALAMPNPTIEQASAIILGSVLPDIDSKTSLLGRFIPVIPHILPHRTITHSLLMLCTMAAINRYLALGVALHIVLDMLTRDGVPLLWPITKKVRFPLIASVIRSGGLIDGGMGTVIWLANIMQSWQVIAGTAVS